VGVGNDQRAQPCRGRSYPWNQIGNLATPNQDRIPATKPLPLVTRLFVKLQLSGPLSGDCNIALGLTSIWRWERREFQEAGITLTERGGGTLCGQASAGLDFQTALKWKTWPGPIGQLPTEVAARSRARSPFLFFWQA